MKTILKKIKGWIAVDGLLHILVNYSIVVSFALIDIIPGLMVAVGLSFLKEAYDVSYKRNNAKEVFHDVVCDIIGISVALGIYTLLA